MCSGKSKIHLFGLQTSNLWVFSIYPFIIHNQSNCVDIELANHCFSRLLIYHQNKACLISMPILKFSKYHALFETKLVSRQHSGTGRNECQPNLTTQTWSGWCTWLKKGMNSCKLSFTSRHKLMALHGCT